MAKDDYFVIVFKILCYLYDCLKHGKTPDMEYLSTENKLFPVGVDYWNYIMVHLVEEGYIDHVQIIAPDGSKPFAVLKESVEITPKGIEYLQENSMMKKVFEKVKDVSNLGFSVVSLF